MEGNPSGQRVRQENYQISEVLDHSCYFLRKLRRLHHIPRSLGDTLYCCCSGSGSPVCKRAEYDNSPRSYSWSPSLRMALGPCVAKFQHTVFSASHSDVHVGASWVLQ